MNGLTFLNAVLCAAIFVTCFFRITKMDNGTDYWVRLATTLLATSALAMGGAPFVPEWQIVLSVPQLFLELSIFMVQLISSRLWWKGVPKAFQQPTQYHRPA